MAKGVVSPAQGRDDLGTGKAQRGQTCVQTCALHGWPRCANRSHRVSGRAAELRSQEGQRVYGCVWRSTAQGRTMTCGSLSALMEMEEAGLRVEWATAGWRELNCSGTTSGEVIAWSHHGRGRHDRRGRPVEDQAASHCAASLPSHANQDWRQLARSLYLCVGSASPSCRVARAARKMACWCLCGVGGMVTRRRACSGRSPCPPTLTPSAHAAQRVLAARLLRRHTSISHTASRPTRAVGTLQPRPLPGKVRLVGKLRLRGGRRRRS